MGALTPGLRHLKVGQDAYQASGVSVKALSPRDAAVLGSNKLTPPTAPTIRKLAALAPTTLAMMHG